MRTTIRLDDALLRRAKARAAANGKSLNDFIADAVRAALASRPDQGQRPPLPSYDGRGLQPGVDLDDTAALLDRMDERAGAYHVSQRPTRVAEKRPRRER